MQRFEAYCNPKKNLTYERCMFFTSVQGDMTISQYVTDLKTKPKSCEVSALESSLIRDRIVCGINLDSVREPLLREVDISLERAISICQASEMSKAHLKQMCEEDRHVQESKYVDAKKEQHKAQKKDKHKPKDGKTKEKFKCKRCGSTRLS